MTSKSTTSKSSSTISASKQTTQDTNKQVKMSHYDARRIITKSIDDIENLQTFLKKGSRHVYGDKNTLKSLLETFNTNIQTVFEDDIIDDSEIQKTGSLDRVHSSYASSINQCNFDLFDQTELKKAKKELEKISEAIMKNEGEMNQLKQKAAKQKRSSEILRLILDRINLHFRNRLYFRAVDDISILLNSSVGESFTVSDKEELCILKSKIESDQLGLYEDAMKTLETLMLQENENYQKCKKLTEKGLEGKPYEQFISQLCHDIMFTKEDIVYHDNSSNTNKTGYAKLVDLKTALPKFLRSEFKYMITAKSVASHDENEKAKEPDFILFIKQDKGLCYLVFDAKHYAVHKDISTASKDSMLGYQSILEKQLKMIECLQGMEVVCSQGVFIRSSGNSFSKITQKMKGKAMIEEFKVFCIPRESVSFGQKLEALSKLIEGKFTIAEELIDKINKSLFKKK